MSEHHDTQTSGSARERELEIEVARLQAELNTLRGEDPTAATSRFLAMAAATVDQAVEDARREADEIVEEISSQAEARRDEATRVAAEAEAMAETLLAEADRAQETIDEARIEAESITALAKEEADRLIEAEREKVTGEMEALAEVRSALSEERESLETYHETLRSRVQELAESMVSFMTTELPVGAATAIENLATREIDPVVDDTPALGETHAVVEDVDDCEDDERTENEAEQEPVEIETLAQADDSVEAEHETDAEDPWTMPAGAALAADDVDAAADPWTAVLESAVGADVPDAADDSDTDLSDADFPDAEFSDSEIFDMPDSAIDEIPAGPPTMFDGREVLESDVEDDMKPTSAGLFSRARGHEAADVADVFEDLANDFDRPSDGTEGGLFGMLGSRLVEQTSPEALADALEDDADEDDAFREFIAGDDEPDPSRDWLMRPEPG